MSTIKTWHKIAGVILLGGITASTHAEDLQQAIQSLSSGAAQQYVAPIVSGFGANLNSGWYHKAPTADKFRFTIEGGVIAMGTFLSSGNKTFDVTTTFRFDSSQSSGLVGNHIDTSTVQGRQIRQSLVDTLRSRDFTVGMYGPTVIGSSDSTVKVVFTGQPITVHYGSGAGRDTTITSIPNDTMGLTGVTGILHDFLKYPLPLVAPQVTLGTVFGTNLTIRWLPTIPAGDIGDVSFFGFGIQHNPAVWLGRSLPIDVCLGYFHQDLTVGSLFEASTNAIGIDVSKQFGWRLLNVTPYGGVQWESSSMTFHYDFQAYDPTTGVNMPEHVQFDMDGENSFRATAGLSFHVLILNINADYSFAKYNSVSAGLMFGM